jgi:Ran GTPase-activating protein (RanGAP) involved in mRNA processing and transport
MQCLVSFLQRNPIFSKIDLSNCSVSDEALGVLGDWLQSATAKLNLDLSENLISPQGIATLLKALEKSTAVRGLSLGNGNHSRLLGTCNELGEMGGVELAKFVLSNKMLVQLNLKNLDSVGVNAFARTYISVAEVKGTFDSALGDLDLSGCDVDDKALEGLLIALVPTCVERVHLQNVKVGPHGQVGILKLVEHAQNLSYLNLSSTGLQATGRETSKTAQNIPFFSRLPFAIAQSSLKHLVMNDNNLGRSGAAAIAQILSRQPERGGIRIASFSNCKLTQMSSIFQGLKESLTLRSIDLSDNGVGDGQCRSLYVALTTDAQRAKLKADIEEAEKSLGAEQKQNLNTTGILDGFGLFQPHHRTEKVDPIALGSLSTFSRVFQKQKSPIIQNVMNKLRAAALISAGVAHHVEKRKEWDYELHQLRCIQLRNSNIGDQGFDSILQLACANRHLTKLDLRGNTVTDLMALKAMDAIHRGETSLVALLLDDNQVSSVTLDAIKHSTQAIKEAQQMSRLSAELASLREFRDKSNDYYAETMFRSKAMREESEKLFGEWRTLTDSWPIVQRDENSLTLDVAYGYIFPLRLSILSTVYICILLDTKILSWKRTNLTRKSNSLASARPCCA